MKREKDFVFPWWKSATTNFSWFHRKLHTEPEQKACVRFMRRRTVPRVRPVYFSASRQITFHWAHTWTTPRVSERHQCYAPKRVKLYSAKQQLLSSRIHHSKVIFLSLPLRCARDDDSNFWWFCLLSEMAAMEMSNTTTESASQKLLAHGGNSLKLERRFFPEDPSWNRARKIY